MSRKDEHTRATFNEIMASNRAYSPRPSSVGRAKRERTYHEPSVSRGSGTTRSHHSGVDNQAMEELQEVYSSSSSYPASSYTLRQKYSTVVEGFKILESELQQTQDRLAAAEAANRLGHDSRISEIGSLKAELADCKEALERSEMVRDCVAFEHRWPKFFQRGANLSGQILEAVTCQICHSLPVQPYRFACLVDYRDLVLTALDSTDCRHLYCGTCLLEWWEKCKKPTCFSCHQRCLYPPTLDIVHGLLILAHEDSGKETWVDLDHNNSIFSRFFTPTDQTSAPNDGSHDALEEESMHVESTTEVKNALVSGGERTQEQQSVVYGGGSTLNI